MEEAGGFQKNEEGFAEKHGGKMSASTSCPDGNCKNAISGRNASGHSAQNDSSAWM
jgi:hypothetical protein